MVANFSFPFQNKGITRLKQKNNISINVLGYKKKQAYPTYLSKENAENYIELL